MSLEELRQCPPKISITAVMTQGKEEDKNEAMMQGDLALVGKWLTRLEDPYEAQLTYEYFLPADQHDRYKILMAELEEQEKAWKIIEDEFIRFYTYKLWGGNPVEQIPAEGDLLQKFDYQFLDAIRDVERDMFTGRSTLLKDVLDFFLDYDIKADKGKGEDEKLEQIKIMKQQFGEEAAALLENLQKRLEAGKKQILSYASDIGALFEQSPPDFAGIMSEQDLFAVLNLVVKQGTHTNIPISHNGLGYNNLIYIALLLSKMQIDADGSYLGSNAKHYPMLAIEEPEAHLHPTMQYQFLSFLAKNMKQNKVRQVFVTTHSTHMVASVALDNIICLFREGNQVVAAYPGATFVNDYSKKYVQRFLDATKSDMLFAEKVVLVEGITEQLLLSVFARYLGEKYHLEHNHVSVIDVGGITFRHFLTLFDVERSDKSIKRKVACLTDIDPMRKIKDGERCRFKGCYPFEYGLEVNYDYKRNDLLGAYENHPNIKMFHSKPQYGKTFEYDLVWNNPALDLLITDSISNKKELENLMQAYREGQSFAELKEILNKSKENERICTSLDQVDWKEDEKKRALIASRYQNSVEKGQNALELSYTLENNLNKRGAEGHKELVIPDHIKQLIKWVCDQ